MSKAHPIIVQRKRSKGSAVSNLFFILFNLTAQEKRKRNFPPSKQPPFQDIFKSKLCSVNIKEASRCLMSLFVY